ncbi:uncharacterized protein M421DRAFT_403040 [Didymella exigua CBS 183.55]|uniref:Uncharacterized protein n=1 Tax=Didymella exigua CBS 183.55 TaxID=1150837 RepID=A0A6A5S143_9PLEO|nr:uncharacterized protein M421DRAFT_403040 [Didymella exigua CBS 183.55]KAF1932206.1 hypothetical protein M421DRAFT_403040 [Didymella exigua CBS 183.55]
MARLVAFLGVQLNLAACAFASPTVICWGHHISPRITRAAPTPARSFTSHKHGTGAKRAKKAVELRNRIYDFVQYIIEGDPVESRKTRELFDGLEGFDEVTSKCRPVWLTNCSVRNHANFLGGFIHALYPAKNEYQYASRQLIVSYSSSFFRSRVGPIDLSLLALLRAHYQTYSCSFLPHQIIEIHRKQCPDNFKDCYIWMCNHQRFYKDACGQHEKIDYTSVYKSIIANGNEAWLEDVEEETFTIHGSFDDKFGNIKARFRFRQDFARGTDTAEKAQSLLKRGGSASLEHGEHKGITFEFWVSKDEGDYSMSVSNFRKVEIRSEAGDEDPELRAGVIKW